jgi:hypothetical protein
VYTGATTGHTELDELPHVIEKAGYRRSLAMSLTFWHSELNAERWNPEISYKYLVPQRQYLSNAEDHWDEMINDLYWKQQEIIRSPIKISAE